MRGASEPSPKKKIEGDLYCHRPLRLAAEGSKAWAYCHGLGLTQRFPPCDAVDHIEPLLRGSSTNQHDDRVFRNGRFKASLAIYRSLPKKRLRLALAAGDRTGPWGVGRDQKGGPPRSGSSRRGR